MECYGAHLGIISHRESWAEEMCSPKKQLYTEGEKELMNDTTERTPRRTIVDEVTTLQSENKTFQTSSEINGDEVLIRKAMNISTDTLVVVSKVKALIKEQSGYNTSKCCIDALTKKVVLEVLKAIERVKESERKTIMGRDVV